MSVVGSLIFCVDCGNLLDSVTDKSKNLDCSQCGHSYPSKNFANLKVVTKSAEGAFPSVLKSKRSEVKTIIGKSDMEEGATVSFMFLVNSLPCLREEAGSFARASSTFSKSLAENCTFEVFCNIVETHKCKYLGLGCFTSFLEDKQYDQLGSLLRSELIYCVFSNVLKQYLSFAGPVIKTANASAAFKKKPS